MICKMAQSRPRAKKSNTFPPLFVPRRSNLDSRRCDQPQGTRNDLTSSFHAVVYPLFHRCEAVSTTGFAATATLKTRKDTVRILLSRPWNDQDVAALRKMWEEGVPVRKLALRFRRSQSAIRGKAVQLGLKRPVQPVRQPVAEELRAS